MRPTESPCLSPTSTHPADPLTRAGRGTIAVESSAGNTYISRIRANSPLKLLTPRHGSRAAWIIAGSYGGGLLSGDHLHLDVTAGPNSTLFLGTQASTKIYRARDGQSASQQLSLRAESRATCIIAPDPVTPFTGAIYDQRQRIDLADDSSLVLLDWLTAGRCARGERWAFARYSTRTDIFINSRQIFRDAIRLDPSDGPIATPSRTGNFNCLATLLLIGPAVASPAANWLAEINQTPLSKGAPILFSASPIPSGIVVRAAALGPEAIAHWIQHHLAFLSDLLGDNPWSRKW
jgi:urease accessory protein